MYCTQQFDIAYPDGDDCWRSGRFVGIREVPWNFPSPRCVESCDDSQVVVNNDSKLIAEALSGNSGAFGMLVERYQDRLYNTMVHVVGSAEDARDVVQDAFVQAFVKLETFQQSAAFYTWLYRIAFNLAMSRLRRKKPTVSVEQVRESTGLDPVDPHGTPDGPLEKDERVAMVRNAIAQLKEDHRRVLVLREIDGYAYDEISEILDLPVGTVRSRLHRARMELRDQLKDLLQTELQD